MVERECPRCGSIYNRDFSALSRVDNKTWICPDCGRTEALENWSGTFIPDTHIYWDDKTDQAKYMTTRQQQSRAK